MAYPICVLNQVSLEWSSKCFNKIGLMRKIRLEVECLFCFRTSHWISDHFCYSQSTLNVEVWLSRGVNFIIVLQAAFTCADPESVKIKLSCQYLFTLLGYVGVKAASRMLMKLTPCLPSNILFSNLPTQEVKLYIWRPYLGLVNQCKFFNHNVEKSTEIHKWEKTCINGTCKQTFGCFQ